MHSLMWTICHCLGIGHETMACAVFPCHILCIYCGDERISGWIVRRITQSLTDCLYHDIRIDHEINSLSLLGVGLYFPIPFRYIKRIPLYTDFSDKNAKHKGSSYRSFKWYCRQTCNIKIPKYVDFLTKHFNNDGQAHFPCIFGHRYIPVYIYHILSPHRSMWSNKT